MLYQLIHLHTNLQATLQKGKGLGSTNSMMDEEHSENELGKNLGEPYKEYLLPLKCRYQNYIDKILLQFITTIGSL